MFGREELELLDVNGVNGTIYYPEGSVPPKC